MEVFPKFLSEISTDAVRVDPEKAFCESETGILSYGKLHESIFKIAVNLRSAGIEKGDVVGLYLEKGAELYSAYLGIIESGAVCLPLDTGWHSNKLEYVLQAASPSFIIAKAGTSLDPFPVIEFEQLTNPYGDGRIPEFKKDQDDTAILLFTSGSTSDSKGVRLSHRGISLYCQSFSRYLNIAPADRIPQFASIGFDTSIEEIFCTLASGATLLPVGAEAISGVEPFLNWCEEREVSILDLPTAYWHEIAYALEKTNLSFPACIHSVAIGGERASGARVTAWNRITGGKVRLVNGYGPTEASIVATVSDLTNWFPDPMTSSDPPIGKAIFPASISLVAQDGTPVESGETGEILISGEGVANGYLNNPETGSSGFLTDPNFPNQLAFRTGDLARYGEDGQLYFSGRIDDQVKVSGNRLSIGEIEEYLLSVSSINEAAVVSEANEEGGMDLVAFFSPVQPIEVLAEIRSGLEEALSIKSLPLSFRCMESLPKTASLKIDRQGLLNAIREATEVDSGSAEGETTRTILQGIFCEVLRVPTSAENLDFFASGGHSLAALRLMTRIRETFGIQLTIGDVFRNRTVASLAGLIDSASIDPGKEESDVIPKTAKITGTLSPVQEFILMECLGCPDLPIYNEVMTIHFGEAVDPQLMQAAFNDLLDRHEVFRTSFDWESGSLSQTIIDSIEVELPVRDFQKIPESTRDREVEEIASHWAAELFNLSKPPLIRAFLGIFDDEDFRLYLVSHHLVDDGSTGFQVIVDDLQSLYDARKMGKEECLGDLPVRYLDYAAFRQASLGSVYKSASLAYWRNKLENSVPFELPTDRKRQERVTYNGARLCFHLSPELTHAVKLLSGKMDTTVFILLLSAFKILMQRLVDQEDVMLGSVVSDRDMYNLEGIAGCFLNYLVLRTKLERGLSIKEALSRVQETLLEAVEHQDVSLTDLKEAANLVRDPSRHPFYQIMFLMESPTDHSRTRWQANQLEFHTGTSKLDLTFQLDESETGIFGRVEYNTDLYEAETIERLVKRYLFLLGNICAQPEATVGELAVMPPEEVDLVLNRFNDTRVVTDPCLRLHDGLIENARRHPERVAVVFGSRKLTYGQLHSYSENIAAHLQANGLELEGVVAVVAQRSEWLPVALFGILKAGGAYLPVDPDQPMERIQFLIEDSGARAVLLGNEASAPSVVDVPAFLISNLAEKPADKPPEDLSRPENLAYVMYTSGSTGKPKGTLVEHRSILNRLLWMIEQYSLDVLDVHYQKTPTTFDVSVPELFVWSMVGSRVVMPQPGDERDPAAIIRDVASCGVTQIHFVPSMLEAFLEYLKAFGIGEELASLRNVYCSGEAISPVVVEGFKRLVGTVFNVGLHNLYGPTEAAVEVSSFDCDEYANTPSIPIGKPVWNTQLYVLDKQLNPVPIGSIGDLYIGGLQVARGYLNRTELTDQVFLTNPHHREPPRRLYRTGDLARWLNDGNVEYLGRTDFQIKIRGIRIELGEIEAAIRKVPGVSGAVVTARGKTHGTPGLLAYYTCESKATDDLSPGIVRDHLNRMLPAHMVPGSIMELEQFPLGSSGKVNRRALPEPEGEDVVRIDDPEDYATDPIAGVVSSIWSKVLGYSGNVRRGGFFEQGGHSLLTVQLISRVRQSLGIDVSIPDFLKSPNFDSLLEEVRAAKRRGGTHSGPLPREPGDKLPLSWGQRRLWFLHQLDSSRTAHNIVLGLQIRGPVDNDLLAGSVRNLIDRHEALRTVFTGDHGEPVQVIRSVEQMSAQKVRWEELKTEDPEETAAALIQEGYAYPFDLETGPLMVPRLVALGPDFHLLVIIVHHIICDEIAAGILLEEIAETYNRLKRKSDVLLDKPKLHAGDVAVWERSAERVTEARVQLDWWIEQLEGAPHILNLPTDYPRPPETIFEGARIALALEKDLSERFAATIRELGNTPFMGFLSAWALLLGQICRQEDLVIGAPVSLRTLPGLDRTVGFLVNSLPFRIKWAPGVSVRDYLDSVRRVALEGYQRADLPFEQLVEAIKPRRSAGIPPVFQVMMVMEGTQTPSPRFEDCEAEVRYGDSDASKFDLTLFAAERDGTFHLEIEYRRDLFDPATISNWLEGLVSILECFADNPDAMVGSIPCLGAEDRLRQDAWSSGPDLQEAGARSIHGLFINQARTHPNSVALEGPSGSISYGRLDLLSANLAGVIRESSLIPESRVGVCFHRSLGQMVGMLAAMRAGGVYVPLDPDWPDLRLKWILADAGIETLLLEDGVVAEHIKGLLGVDSDLKRIRVISVPADLPEADPIESAPGEANSPAESLAYIIYTSGSTGQPKGVLVEHRNVVASTIAREGVYGECPERFMLLSPAVFDSSIAGIFWTLGTGGTLILPPVGAERDPDLLVEFLSKQQITHYLTLPSVHGMLLGRMSENAHCLQTVIVAGEPCPVSLPGAHRRRLPGVRLFNEYGPTEGTVWCSACEITSVEADQQRVSVGSPIPGVRLNVVNTSLRLIPRGGVGEIVIAGMGVARGYHGRSDLTNQRFVSMADDSGAVSRVYRTGDLGRWLPDGRLDFLGRLDDQIKIRGYRIELGEIESVLSRIEGIGECAVVVHQTPEGDRQLVAYVHCVDSGEEVVDVCRNELASRLPYYMIPSAVVTVDQFPRTSSGKIDRHSLSMREVNRVSRLAGETDDPLLLDLIRIWESIIGVKGIGIHDDFFELGGDSFMAVRLFSRIEKDYGISLSIGSLYTGATIRSLAGLIGTAESRKAEEPVIVPIREAGSRPPLFFIHPRDGGVLIYRELGEGLRNDRPVFGVEAPWRQHDITGDDTIEAIARHYLPSILKHCNPSQPVHLCGYSTGGLIAFELGQQLNATGRAVGVVMMLDTYNPGNPPERQKFHVRWGRRIRDRSGGVVVKMPFSAVELVYKTLHIKLFDFLERSGAWRARIVRRRNGQVPLHLRHFESRSTILSATDRYVPKAYSGDLVLFCAKELDTGYEAKENLGWNPVAGSRFRMVPLSGDHMNILKPPFVNELALAVDCAIEDFENKIPRSSQGRVNFQ